MKTGKIINQISSRLRRRSKKAQESIGISGAKSSVLNYILIASENHPVYQKEIEKEFGMRPSTATEALKSLEEDGLIKRVPEERDARYKRLMFTDKADAVKDVIREEIRGTEQLLLKGITEEELNEFMRIAGKMLANLEEDEKEREEREKRR